ncbi:NUDIX hydrolase [Bifidobacterium sp. W8109]|uniref:NUDIX hydrolase n=1 Tax=Bifidobacterium TaxID=1678 RepID=UPI0018DC8AD6|nr:NUDIX hydrolase [Bifidobacterium asteroides]MBI0072830.1 NUDIX hydrolase [Bifidobacterium sp. W8110]
MNNADELGSTSPLQEIRRRKVFEEAGGADFTVTAVDVKVRDTGADMTLHVASVKQGQPGVICVAVVEQGGEDFYLIARHWRVAVEDWLWEFPRGMGEQGENPQTTAIRELHEETGLWAQPDAVHQLHRLHADAGVLQDDVRVMEIRLDDVSSIPVVDSVNQGGDWELEDLHWLRSADITNMIRDGRLIDGPTIAAFSIREIDRRRQ